MAPSHLPRTARGTIRRSSAPGSPEQPGKHPLPPGWPPEVLLRRALRRLLAGYLVVTGLAFLFPHRPSLGPLWAAGHLVAAATILGLGPFRGLKEQVRRRCPRLSSAVSDWYALLLLPLLYRELVPLNRAVHGGRYFDWVILRLETTLLGLPSGQEWAAQLPYLALSEVLHLCYLSYYAIIYLPPVYLYVQGRRAEHQGMIFSLMLAFLVHYLVFVFFPVQGPRYLFPPPGAPLDRGWFFRLAHAVLEAGSAQGSAFPSSHVGVAVVQAALAWRWLPKAAPLLSLATLGLALGAVYGGFHYVTDILAGGLLGLTLRALAPTAARRLGGGAGYSAAQNIFHHSPHPEEPDGRP